MIAESRLESPAYLAASRGQPCTLRITGVCCRDWSTTVPAHVRDRHTGGARKASDCSIVDACVTCHAAFDRRAKMPNGRYITDDEWRFYALRGIQETLESRIRRGIQFKLPPARPRRKQDPKPRKPKDERVKIASSPRRLAKGRKLKSGNNLRRSKSKATGRRLS